MSDYPTDELPLFRSTDPETSRAAVGELDLDGARRVAFEACRALVVHDGMESATANEIGRRGEAICGHQYNCETIRKRVGRLAVDGVFMVCKPRRCGVTNKMATTYRVAT